MAAPIVFISRNRVREGKGEEFRAHYRDSIPRTEAEKPETMAQLTYESEDGAEVTVVRLFHDAEALDQQLQGAGDRSRKTYEFIEPVSIEIYGEPNASTVEMMKKIAGSGIQVRIHRTYLGGFIRSPKQEPEDPHH